MALGQNPKVEWKCGRSVYHRRIAGGLVLSEMGHEGDAPGQ